MKNVNKVILILLALLCVTFIGCENAAKTEEPSNTIVQNIGYFIDAPVAGLAYETSSGIKDVTDETGAYKYNAGDKVKFLIGNAQLGKEIEASPVVTPCTLTGATTIEDKTTDGKPTEAAKEALNMVKMFMALDSDDSDFGIKIPENLNTETLTTENLDALIKAADFDTRASEVINEIVGEEKEIPTDEEAKEHYNQVAGQIDGEENLDEHQKLLEAVQNHLKWNTDDKLVVAAYLPEDITYIHYSFSADQKITTTGRSISLANNKSISVTGFDSDFLVDNVNYGLTITALQDKSRFTVGDLKCYYNGTSFQKTPVENYPIPIDFDKQRVVYADFTSDKHTAKIENVYKVSGTITVNDIEDLGIADGQTLNSSPFTFFVHMDEYKVSLKNPILSTTKKNGKIVFEYETYLPSETTRLEISYKPFNSNDYHFNDNLRDMNLSSDITHNFEMSIRYGNEDDSTEDPVTPPAEGGDDNTEDPVTPPAEGGDDSTEDPVTPPAEGGDDNTEDPVTPPAEGEEDNTEDPVIPEKTNNFAGKTFIAEWRKDSETKSYVGYLEFTDEDSGKFVIPVFCTTMESSGYELKEILFTYSISDTNIAEIAFEESTLFENIIIDSKTSELENDCFYLGITAKDDSELSAQFTFRKDERNFTEEWTLSYAEENFSQKQPLIILLYELSNANLDADTHYTIDNESKEIILEKEGYEIFVGNGDENDTENPSEPTPDLPESVGEDVLAGTSYYTTGNLKNDDGTTENLIIIWNFGNDGKLEQKYETAESGESWSEIFSYSIDSANEFLYLASQSNITTPYIYKIETDEDSTVLKLYKFLGENLDVATVMENINGHTYFKNTAGIKIIDIKSNNTGLVITFYDETTGEEIACYTTSSIEENTIFWESGEVSEATATWDSEKMRYLVTFTLNEKEYELFLGLPFQLLTKQ